MSELLFCQCRVPLGTAFLTLYLDTPSTDQGKMRACRRATSCHDMLCHITSCRGTRRRAAPNEQLNMWLFVL